MYTIEYKLLKFHSTLILVPPNKKPTAVEGFIWGTNIGSKHPVGIEKTFSYAPGIFWSNTIKIFMLH